MSYEENLFSFGRSLPQPFENSPRRINVNSIYSGQTTSTMVGGVLKAVLAAFGCMSGTGRGALGTINDQYCVAEYKSSVGEQYHIVVYNKKNCSIMASVYDPDTNGTLEQYKCNRTNRDGTAILFAMMPILLSDKEFSDNFNALYSEYLNNWADMNKAENYAALLCDNAYRRLKDPNCGAPVTVNLEKSGNVTRVSAQAISQKTYEPDNVIFGSFEVFSKTGASTNTSTTNKSNGIDHKDFIGKYSLDANRVLTAKEASLVPYIADHIIITPEAVDMCELAHGTTGKVCAQRNFLLRGGAGSGKTCTSKQVAAGLGLPLVTLTCHPDLSMDELIGVMLPKTNEDCSGDAKVLDDMGGATPENIARLLNLPDLDVIEFDPEDAYKQITGKEKAKATQQECMAAYTEAIARKAGELASSNKSTTGTEYVFVEGVLLKAIKYGWVCELQEPTVIARPGVLAGLNNILEQGGNITLPDGRVIIRHPDAVVICTTNISYEGCRGLNQSVIDRMNQVYDVETPNLDTMVERAMNLTGEIDEDLVRRMAQVTCDVATYCKQNCITNGVTGMRVLIDWVASNQVKNNPFKTALSTIIAKATSDEEERYAIQTACLEPFFAPSVF